MNSSARQIQLIASLLSDPGFSQAAPPTAFEQLLLQRGNPSVSRLPSVSLLQATTPVALAAYAAALTQAPIRPARPVPVSSLPIERHRFLMFTKILFKYLDRLGNPSLKARAKMIIAQCTQRNRQGDPAYMPLMSAVERQLRQSLGEIHYARAQTCYNTFLRKTATRPISLNASNVQTL